MKTVFFLVKFFDNPNHADDFVHGRVFANRLSRFKKAEDSDAFGRMDRHEGTKQLRRYDQMFSGTVFPP